MTREQLIVTSIGLAIIIVALVWLPDGIKPSPPTSAASAIPRHPPPDTPVSPLQLASTSRVPFAHVELETDSTEPDEAGAPVEPTPEPPEVIDRSGLSRDHKVEVVREAEARFRDALASDDQRKRTASAHSLALQCAIAVLRERGDVQYEYDVDDGTIKGFRLSDVPHGYIGIGSSNGKYEISRAEFPAYAMTRDRYMTTRHGDITLDPFSVSELSMLDTLVQRAYLSLGVE